VPVRYEAGHRSDGPKLGVVSVRVDCRHYSRRTVSAEEIVQRCRVDAADAAPFSCPEHCLFFEERPYRDGGWTFGLPNT
jgi:hypothetical protein